MLTTFREFDAMPSGAQLEKITFSALAQFSLIPRKAFALLNTIPAIHVSLQLKLSFLLMLCKKCAIKNSSQMTTIPSTDGTEDWVL